MKESSFQERREEIRDLIQIEKCQKLLQKGGHKQVQCLSQVEEQRN